MIFERPTQQKYLVGIDLRDDFCQISYMENPGHSIPREPVTFSYVEGQEQFNIPTALCKATGLNKWFAGQEANTVAGDGGGTFIPKVLSLALKGEPVMIEGAEYDPIALLSLYLSRCLGMMEEHVKLTEIAAITITTRTLTDRLVSVLDGVKTRLDLHCVITYEDYANTFFNFLLTQPKVLREPAAVLCEYDKGGKLVIDKMKFNERTTPIVAFREEKVYDGPSEGLDDLTPQSIERLTTMDQRFLKVLEEEVGDDRYGSAFLIGSGFQEDWMRKSIAYLVKGRRAFMGNNLYSRGAAYSALFRVNPPKTLTDYYFLDSNRLKSNIGIRALVHGEEQYVALVDAGANYYEVNTAQELVIEGGNELYLVLTPLTGGKPSDYLIRLEGLPVREERSARIRLHFAMTEPNKVHVEIEDLGFGEIFPSTGLRWVQEMTIG